MRSILLFAIVASSLCSEPVRAEPSTCETCHADTAKRTEHQNLTEKHVGQGCVSCHGGDDTQKDAAAAHAQSGPKGMLPRPHTNASCTRCHLPGAVKGTEDLVAGARTYQDLGCPYCHNSSGYGSPERWSPALTQVGHRGPAYLKQMLNTPYQILPGTRMPSFTSKWKDNPARETALVTYLLTLRGEPRAQGRTLAKERCATCHAKDGVKKDRITSHRCVELADPKKELSCVRCHPKGAPVSDRECLYVRQRQLDCGVCHMGEGDETRSP